MTENKLWDIVELFEWRGKFTVRDVVTKKQVMAIHEADRDGREYWTIKKVREEIGPLIVNLMNGYTRGKELIENSQNGHEDKPVSIIPQIAKIEIPKKRGRPKKS